MSRSLRPCPSEVRAGRLTKARQFLDAAETVRELSRDERDVGDAYFTLCVHAGIAAADALCCGALGRHASGEAHHEAVALLAEVEPGGRQLAAALKALLDLKTRAGYTASPVSAAQCKRAGRRAAQLVNAARQQAV